MRYELVTSIDGETYTCVLRYNEDGSQSFIPMDEANSDYRAYLKSLEPEIVEEPVVEEPPGEDPIPETPAA